jgi:hypothetical protein
MSAVYQNSQLHLRWPAQLPHRIKRCADGATREEHIIYQYDSLTVDTAHRDDRREQRASWSRAEIIAMERDVDGPYGDGDAFDARNRLCQTRR